MNRPRYIAFRLLVGGALLGVLVGGSALLHLRAAQSGVAPSDAPLPVPVAGLTVAAASGYDVTDRFVGRLEPAQQVRLSFERDGLVTSVAVEEGDTVDRGTVIATLDSEVLRAERDRLVGLRRQIAANLELARLTEERQLVLQRQGHASAQRLDEARFGAVAFQGELEATEAAIRRLDIDIEKSVIRAPFAGTVGARFADVGAVVASGTSVIDLLESGRPQVRVGLSPKAAAALRAGDRVRLTSAGAPLEGRVAAVRPDVSTATRTVGVLIDVIGTPRVRFGDTVELHVSRRIEADGAWLPLSALTEGDRGLWTVLTLQNESAGTHRIGQEAVELLHIDGDRVFVRGTLRAGQQVIASGRNRIIPGQVVTVADMRERQP